MFIQSYSGKNLINMDHVTEIVVKNYTDKVKTIHPEAQRELYVLAAIVRDRKQEREIVLAPFDYEEEAVEALCDLRDAIGEGAVICSLYEKGDTDSERERSR